MEEAGKVFARANPQPLFLLLHFTIPSFLPLSAITINLSLLPIHPFLTLSKMALLNFELLFVIFLSNT